jgi:hypothetical protein
MTIGITTGRSKLGIPPADPVTDLVATANGTDSIDLSWTDVTNYETGFRIERSLNGTSGWTEITTTAANAVSYSDTGLDPETTYYYRIITEDTYVGRESPPSSVAYDTTEAAPESAFEDAVMALSPVAAYLFRDTDFSTQVADSSGNGYHLSKIYAEASRGASLRPGHHPGAISITNPTNFTTDGTLYRAAVGGLDTLIGGATSISIVVGLQLTSGTFTGKRGIFVSGTDNTLDTGTNQMVSIIDDTGGTYIWFKERHPGGIGYAADTSPVYGEPVVYTSRFHYSSSPGRLLDRGRSGSDVECDYSASPQGGGNIEDVDRTTFIGGRSSVGTSSYRPYLMDHLSVFIPALSNAQLDSLRAAYRAEI